jgi:ribosomal protein S18 acetylase RimI-like enzyme
MQTCGADIELPGGGVVSLRPVAPADEEFLLGVYASTRADELAQVTWSAEQKAAFVRMQFDAQRRDYDVRYPDAEYDVILLDARPVGRLWIGRDDEQIRLLDIALLPEAQNRGVGGALVRQLIAEARQTGKSLRHMVFVLNPDAQRFYERLGFRVFEEVGAYRHMEWVSDAI